MKVGGIVEDLFHEVDRMYSEYLGDRAVSVEDLIAVNRRDFIMDSSTAFQNMRFFIEEKVYLKNYFDGCYNRLDNSSDAGKEGPKKSASGFHGYTPVEYDESESKQSMQGKAWAKIQDSIDFISKVGTIVEREKDQVAQYDFWNRVSENQEHILALCIRYSEILFNSNGENMDQNELDAIYKDIIRIETRVMEYATSVFLETLSQIAGSHINIPTQN